RFKGVNLSTEIANQLRKIILSGIAPVENEFPVYGCKLIDPIKSANCDEIVTNGNCYTRLEEPNIQVYIFIFGGFAWMYIVPKSNEDDPQKDIFLKPSGDIILPKENIRDFQPFKDIYASILQVASSNSRK
ncbi:MAG TPA: hypothetical protein VEF53_13125, partial [Patescibacteria group bacterium]|nr:hypothetical protein [Patescibacteria group bacterium]